MRETMITVAGNVGATPMFYEATNGQEPRLRLTMATTKRVRDRDSGEWRDGNTSWYKVWLQGRLAQNAERSIAKGDAVIVSGSVEIRPWQDGEKSGTEAVISARSFGPDLNKYPVSISRVRVATTEQDTQSADPPADQADSTDSTDPADVPDVSDFNPVDQDGNPLSTAQGAQQEPAPDDSIVGRLASGM